MNKKFVVRLSDEERVVCHEIIKNLKGSSQKFRRAQILLKADADGPEWSDVKIAEAFNCRVQTIENVRKRLVLEGFELALDGKKRPEPPTPCKSTNVQWRFSLFLLSQPCRNAQRHYHLLVLPSNKDTLRHTA